MKSLRKFKIAMLLMLIGIGVSTSLTACVVEPLGAVNGAGANQYRRMGGAQRLEAPDTRRGRA